MKKGHITFVPSGGLANRMKAIASAVRLAEEIGSELRIIWFQDWGLGCRFDQLFTFSSPIPISIQEATFFDKLLYDRPRRKNFYLPTIAEHALFDICIKEEEATRMMQEDFDFCSYCNHRKVWISSNVYFISKNIPDASFDPFHPLPHLASRIDQIVKEMGPHTIGVHIRRTDHILAIANSPTTLFVERMRQESPNTTFYLATDSEDEKRTMLSLFEGRLHVLPRKAKRDSLQGMEDALIEMYVLSRTNLIIGSVSSTYSMTAAAIGRIPLEIIKQS